MHLKDIFNNVFYEPHDWRIAIRNKEDSSELIPVKWNRFNEIKGTDEYSFADPLLYGDERGTFLFVEAINRKTEKGCIGVIDLNCKKYRFSPVITEEFHMSFPFIFSLFS